MLHYLPNFLTLLRCVLVLPFAMTLLASQFDVALFLFLIAGVSDGLDGYLAKRCNWQSRFGAILDPLADKFLLVTAFALLTYLQVIPLWLFSVILLRDLIIVSGALFYHRMFGPFEMKPLLISKLNTVVQILLSLICLTQLATGWPPVNVVTIFIYITWLTTISSGVAYVTIWGQRCHALWPERKRW